MKAKTDLEIIRCFNAIRSQAQKANELLIEMDLAEEIQMNFGV